MKSLVVVLYYAHVSYKLNYALITQPQFHMVHARVSIKLCDLIFGSTLCIYYIHLFHVHISFTLIILYLQQMDLSTVVQLETCLDLFTKEETLDKDEKPVST